MQIIPGILPLLIHLLIHQAQKVGEGTIPAQRPQRHNGDEHNHLQVYKVLRHSADGEKHFSSSACSGGCNVISSSSDSNGGALGSVTRNDGNDMGITKRHSLPNLQVCLKLLFLNLCDEE